MATGKPLVSGAAIRFEGQVAVFPNDGAGPCYRCLYSDEDENFASCAGQGILAPVAGTIGAMLATEALKLLLGLGLRACAIACGYTTASAARRAAWPFSANRNARCALAADPGAYCGS